MSLNPSIRRILLIDDDIDDYIFFRDALEMVDPSVELLHLPSASRVQTDDTWKTPDILFLDINIPDSNGFDVLKSIRGKGFSLPIVMYSTASNPLYVERAYQEGASLYFPKPDSMRALEESLRRLLGFNWSDPEMVKENYKQHNSYRVFSVKD